MLVMLLLALLASIDLALVQRAATEMEAMCAAEKQKLWGRSLCGPLAIADPKTRDAVQILDGRVTTARVPEAVGIANTAVEWDGREWTMLMSPLPEDPTARRVLLAHESFHRIQKDLGFPATGPANTHLDTADARTLMRLEWRALTRALQTRDKAAVADALAFRAQRRALASAAAEDERLLEMHEGLAEHTGWAMAVPRLRERVTHLAKKLEGGEKGDSFVRSFAYVSGPAWGALIEMRDPRWTRKVKATDDLGELARRAWNVTPAVANASRYGGEAVRAEEDARTARKREQLARMRARYVEGPTLRVPLRKMQMTFDPNKLQPFEDLGTEYGTIELTDVWGKISVTGGAVVSSDWTRMILPANGDGYTLTLNPGWEVVAVGTKGDKTLAR